jgi:hypothetical protein
MNLDEFIDLADRQSLWLERELDRLEKLPSTPANLKAIREIRQRNLQLAREINRMTQAA